MQPIATVMNVLSFCKHSKILDFDCIVDPFVY